MNIWYPRSKNLREVEARICGLVGPDRPEVVAAEVYDHPDAGRNRKTRRWDGPWLVGSPDDVEAELALRGHIDFDVIARAYATPPSSCG